MTAGTQLLLDDLRDTYRPPAPFLAGPGWSIPDHGLHRYPPHFHDRSVRAAVEAIERGLGDRVGYWLYARASSAENETDAALGFHRYVVGLRRLRR